MAMPQKEVDVAWAGKVQGDMKVGEQSGIVIDYEYGAVPGMTHDG